MVLSTVFVTSISAHPLPQVFTGTAPIVTLYACVAIVVPFVTSTVNGNVPVAVGVPEMTSVVLAEGLNESPVGSVPDAIDHVNGPVAVPFAVKVCEYGIVVVPFGRDVGEILRVGAGAL